MSVNSKLNILLDKKEFSKAWSLFKEQLEKADIINPKEEETWRDYADQITFNLRAVKGYDAFIEYWEDLLSFFKEKLEPKWGDLNKGRIFFRLGVFYLSNDINRGREFLEYALEESRKQEIIKGTKDVEEEIKKYSSYTALCIVEQIHYIQNQGEGFVIQEEQQVFFENLFTAFDLVIQGIQVEIESIEEFVREIVPAEGVQQIMESWDELNRAYNQRFKIAIVALAGIFTENILLSILSDGLKIKNIRKGDRDIDILEASPYYLLEEAKARKVFQSDDVKVAFQLIHFFRNRGHPGVERAKEYKLTERIARNIKILADQAVSIWGKQIEIQKGILNG
jgi:tetratricopeptide (TPR) repeat protein